MILSKGKNNDVGIGIDIESIDRFKKDSIHSTSFFQRIFTKDEMEYCKRKESMEPHLAVRYAAKEAAVKALYSIGYDNITYNNIEVVNDAKGVPRLVLHIDNSNKLKCQVSLSHCDDKAIALVYIERRE